MTEIARADSWDAIRADFRWDIPADYGLFHDMCEKWAATEPDRLALIHAGVDAREYTFRDLDRLSARLANVLIAHGITRGDRVGVLLPQVPETVLTHLACYRIGAVVLPLFTLFGADGLSYRLSDSGARAVITDRTNLPKLLGIRDDLPELDHVWCTDGLAEGAASLPDALDAARDTCAPVAMGPEEPAFICYTSGTTGPPKGALHGQRVLLGHIPGVQMAHEFWPHAQDRIWTPSDWAWLGGLGNIMMPALKYGVPLLAHRAERFDPEEALRLVATHRITNVFLAPTALKLMRQVPDPGRFAAPLRTIASGGESLGAAMLDWGQEAFGLTINEFYGQTECNLVLTNNAAVMPPRPGSMGKPAPGSDVVILDADGTVLGPDQPGEIAIRRGDAAMFLTYWNQPEKAAEKFVTASDGHDYLRTGDEGHVDADGYFWFAARTDDVITSSGYRVGPSEIEDCLNRHPAVAMSACIGVPDPVRTEIVKAFIVLTEGQSPSDDLAQTLTRHVRDRLSPHVAPREVAWIETLPMTATGKIMRRSLRAQS